MHLADHVRELVRYRTLVSALVGRELKGRYRGSLLGFLWTFLNPLMMLAVYALVFTVYFRVQMDHYTVYMFTGLLPWVFFSHSLVGGAGSVTSGGSLVTKVTFPHQVLPAVQVVANFLNYLFSLPILIVFLLVSGVTLSPALVAFPLVAAVHILFTYGCALLLATSNVFMRDTEHILSNLVTLWFFLTPVFYPVSMVPPSFRILVLINPAAHLTLAYHDIFFWGRWPRWDHLAIMAAASCLFLALALAVFERHKDYFAERI